MRTYHRIGIGILVGLCFASGYYTRLQVMARDEAIETARAQNERRASSFSVGTRIASVGLEGAADIDFRPIETLYSVIRSLKEHYVEQITPENEGKMTYDALKAMLGSLKDPNTRFLEPAQRKVVSDAYEGKFHGIGAVLGIKQIKTPADALLVKSDKAQGNAAAAKDKIADEHLFVISVLPGSPAEKAGLKTGDDIIEVNGKAVLGFDPFQIAERILKAARSQGADRVKLQKDLEAQQKRIENGLPIIDAENLLATEDKKEFELTVVPRGSTKSVKIKLQPGETTVEPVTSALVENDRYGHIRINFFGTQTAERFGEALRDISSKDAKGLVLDLRGVSGGSMDSALQIAKWFAPGKTMATLAKSRSRRTPVAVPELSGGEPWRKPLVVLVDGGTAKTAEVLAAALKDNCSARLVGESTYGDLMETTLLDQPDGSAVAMTTGVYLAGKGVNYNTKGLPVDVKVAWNQPGDRPLKEAIKLLSTAGSKG